MKIKMRFDAVSLLIFILTSFAISSTLLIFLIRLIYTIDNGSFQYTSGAAGIGVYGVLLSCEGKSVYNNLANDPNGYIFNFLFYEIYGFVMREFSTCDENGVLTAHLFTVSLSFTGAAVVFAIARAAGCSAASTVFLSLSPLSPFVGWWAFSVRPDMAAFLFSLIALATANLASVRRSFVISTFCIFFALMAWGFKQTYLAIIPLVVFIMLYGDIDRKLQLFIVSVAILVIGAIGWSMTLDNYYMHTIVFPSAHVFSSEIALQNLMKFGIKCAPYISTFVFACALTISAGQLSKRLHYYLVALGILAVIFAIAAGKIGASDNYYYPVLAFLLVVVSRLLSELSFYKERVALAVGLIAMLASNAVLLSGAKGNLIQEPIDPTVRHQLIQYLRSADGPTLVIDNLYALPTHSGDDVNVRLFDVYIYRHGVAQSGRSLDIDRQLEEAKFSIVAIGTDARSTFDLSRYRRITTIGPMEIYEVELPQKTPNANGGETAHE